MALCGAMIVAGCTDAPPAGQVVARIDGVEVTDRELRGEATAIGIDLSDPAARATALDRLIDRKLLARAGEAALTDRTPAAQMDLRRAREEALARAYARRVTAEAERPASADIDRFMRDNPHRFAERMTFIIDRSSGNAATARGPDGKPDRRMLVLIDSADLDAATAGRLAALAIGDTLRRPGGHTIDTLVLKRPVVEPRDAQRARAARILDQVRATQALETTVRGLRAQASIALRKADAKR